jgi:hypothetical protein
MGMVPPRPLQPLVRKGYQPEEMPLRQSPPQSRSGIFPFGEPSPASEQEENHESTLQCTASARRRFRILVKDREEATAMRQAESAFTKLCARYPGQICSVSRHVLRELYADEGLVGYVINGEIDVLEITTVLSGGFCLNYDGNLYE